MDGGDEGQRGGQRQAGDHPSFPVRLADISFPIVND